AVHRAKEKPGCTRRHLEHLDCTPAGLPIPDEEWLFQLDVVVGVLVSRGEGRVVAPPGGRGRVRTIPVKEDSEERVNWCDDVCYPVLRRRRRPTRRVDPVGVNRT